MTLPFKPETQESFVERIDILFRELELALKWDRPSILLAIYSSDFVRADAQFALAARLRELGQTTTVYRVDEENADIPLHLSEHPDRAHTVFFVWGLQYGGGTDGRNAYRALNIRREYFVDYRLRAVFWLTEAEAIALPKFAPDFWAFRHRVIEFMDRPEPHAAKIVRALAWSDFDERTLREDTDAKIELRLALLKDLPPGDETLAARAELQYTLAGLYWAKQVFDESIRYWLDALKGAEQLQDTRLQAWCYNGLGTVYYALGNYDEAIAAYQRAIALDPKFAYPHNGLGNVYYQLGKYDEAIAAYQRAIALDPKYAYPHNGLGNVYADLGKYDDAIAAYQRAIQLDPKDATPHNGLGNVYYQLGKYDDAIAAYQRAIQLDPKDAYPHNGLGSVYRALGNYDEAIAAYQRAIQLDPKYAYPHNGLGTVYYALGNYDEAIAAYQRAIALDPKFAYPHNGLGNVYYQLGKYDEAIAAYQRAIALDPKYAYPHNGLGNVYRALGNYDEAIAAYQRAIALDPKFAYPHNGLGNVYYQLGKYDEAIAAYQRAIELDPKYAYPHNGLGNVYRALGNYDEAIAAYQRAIQLDPKYASPYVGKATVIAITGDRQMAMQILESAYQQFPDDQEIQLARFSWQAMMGQVQDFTELSRWLPQLTKMLSHATPAQLKMIAQLGQKLELPDAEALTPAHLFLSIAALYEMQENYDEAIAAYQRAIQLDPKDATPHNNLAGVFAKLGRFDEARREYNERIRLAPENPFTPLVALGVIARHQGLAESAEHFQHALEQWDAAWRARWQTPAGLLENKAKALLCLGKKDEALQTLAQSIAQMQPGDTIELDDWELLRTAPAPPVGVEEAIAMLKEAQARRG